ncbi:MAG TPA: dUTP diphosphatase, partial [Vicinamibacteria bacterium]
MADTPSPLDLPALLGKGAALPEYGSADAAGADLRASEAVVIAPGARAAVPTGLRLAIPRGHVGLVWPRSGLAVRHGIDTLAGVIDSDYRGEV